MNTDVELHNKTNLGLIIFAASLVTTHIGISGAIAILPFDELMTPKTDGSKNQSSKDLLKMAYQESMAYQENMVNHRMNKIPIVPLINNLSLAFS